MGNLNGYFSKNYGPLKGSDWIKRIPSYEREALSYIARVASNHGKSGGIARAAMAKRDSNGKFISNKKG